MSWKKTTGAREGLQRTQLAAAQEVTRRWTCRHSQCARWLMATNTMIENNCCPITRLRKLAYCCCPPLDILVLGEVEVGHEFDRICEHLLTNQSHLWSNAKRTFVPQMPQISTNNYVHPVITRPPQCWNSPRMTVPLCRGTLWSVVTMGIAAVSAVSSQTRHEHASFISSTACSDSKANG